MSVITSSINRNSGMVLQAPVKTYIPKGVGIRQTSARTLNLRLDVSKSIASDASFKAAMQRTLVEKKIWEDFLEKLRKAGGGGGGSLRRIDRVAVSMMMTNFLSDKVMKALMQNFNIQFLKQLVIANDKVMQSPILSFISGLTGSFANMFTSFVISMASSPTFQSIGTNAFSFAKGLSTLAAAFSFQMNKLKELLEKELEEAIKKLDFKEKLRRLKEKVTDFFIELKDEALILIELLKAKFTRGYLPSFIKPFSS